MTRVIFGDVVELVIAYLAEHAPDLIVGTEFKKPTSKPTVTINRSGGPQSLRVADQAYVSFDVWAPSTWNGLADAHDVAQTVRSIVGSMTGAVVNGTPIYRVSELAGPARLPSPDRETDRWTFALAVTFRGQST